MGEEAWLLGGTRTCGKAKVKHVPFSGPPAPWLCRCLGSRPGCYGNGQALRKPWLPFPRGPCPPFLAGPLPSCPLQACSLSLTRLLLSTTSWSLGAPSRLPFPFCPQRPSFPLSVASLCIALLPHWPLLSLLDSLLLPGPSCWSPKVGRAGFCPCPHRPRCPVASGNRALPAAASAVPGSGAAAGALASGGSEDSLRAGCPEGEKRGCCVLGKGIRRECTRGAAASTRGACHRGLAHGRAGVF